MDLCQSCPYSVPSGLLCNKGRNVNFSWSFEMDPDRLTYICLKNCEIITAERIFSEQSVWDQFTCLIYHTNWPVGSVML